MRNLKRALSLTLASVMLLGMMVVGAGAASYPDVDESNNIEAIEVLQAVKVMEGDNAGNFDPDRPVSRAEMAVIMALLLNLDYDYYRGTKTFNDVPSWCAPYVAACYANGITSGYNATTYGSADTVNAVQAASMMMRALGYFKFSSDYEGDFVLSTVKQASKIELFKGINANSMDPLTRNQVAQLALNALKTPIVEPDDNTITIKDANGNIIATGGQVNYVVTASSQAYARAIDDAESKGTALNGVQGYIIELGEKLYSGKLKLNDDARDDFGRPSRKWEYDGKPVGTYAKYELISQEYTKEVTGRELYDLLGADTINSIKKGGSGEYSLNVAIDGIDDSKIDSNVFNVTAINRNNKAGVGATGNGVLTQVFVDGNKKVVDIAVINTYLARADKDYDAKKETVDLTVYGLKKSGSNLLKEITAGDDSEPLKVSSEDFVVEDVKEKDSFLVTVADGEVQSMASVSPMAGVEITSFQARKPADRSSGNLTTDGTKYDFSDAAEYDNPCLKVYTDGGDNVNLKNVTYDVYLDRYGYVIGVVEVDKVTNYVFITGVDSGNNNLANTTLEANAIFMDGSMKKIEIDRNNSKTFVEEVREISKASHQDNSTFNKWCTYSVNNKDVYSLDLVAVDGGSGKAGQTVGKTQLKEINNKHLSVETKQTTGTYMVYGNNKSVYLGVTVDEIQTIAGRTDCIIDGVDSVTTGIDNVDVVPLYGDKAREAAGDDNHNAATFSQGIYTLYDKNGWIIAMVIVGDDNGKNSQLVYVHNESVAQEYYMGDDGYKWERTVIVDGEEVTLTEVNDVKLSMLQQMGANNWYRVKTNAKNEVTAIDGSYDKVADIDNDDNKVPGPINYNNDKSKIGNWGFKADGTTRTAYVTDYDAANNGIVDNLRRDSVDTILFHEKFINEKPSADNQTIYVTTGKDSGIRFAEDVKVVLDQENDKKRTTEYGTGETQLKNMLKELHKNADENYDYEISAIIEGPYATSIVIKDLIEDGYTGEPQTDVTGAKAAISSGADTPTTAGATLQIGYLTENDKPKTAADVQAIVKEYADLMGWTLGDVQGTTSPSAGEIIWGVKNSLGADLGNIKLNTTTGIIQGVRVNYADDAAKGYEIKALTSGSFNAKETGKYVKYNDGNGDKWSTKGGDVLVTGHDWKVYKGVDSKVTIDGSTYYGNAATMNIVGNAAAVAAGTAAVDSASLKPGTTIECDDTIKHPTYTAAASQNIADGKTYNSGYIKIDATGVSSVSVGGTAVTADTDYYVPANSAVAILLTDTSGKSYLASDADGSIGNVLTTAATNDAAHTLNITVRAKDVAVGQVTKLTLPAAIEDVGTTGMTLAWSLNGQAVSGDVYVSATDKLKATVTFSAAFDDANTTADTLTAAATGATIKAVLSNAVGTATGGAVTLVTDEIPANSTIVFEIVGATANPTITYAAN